MAAASFALKCYSKDEKAPISTVSSRLEYVVKFCPGELRYLNQRENWGEALAAQALSTSA